jgi:UDP:flavonoid glycosyltransferase YjiC (YdhE family)
MMNSTVFWVIGPALGHVSRSLVVARRLRSDFGVDSQFCGSDLHGHHAALLDKEFQHHDLRCQRDEMIQFAERVENLIVNSRPDLVCFDCSPLPWLAALGALPAPAVFLTNWFVTSLNPEPTLQDQWWAERLPHLQQLRREQHLVPAGSARDLYELGMKRILLADPQVLLPGTELPDRFRVVGACIWEPQMDLPKALAAPGRLIYVALGSTGRRPIPPALINSLVERLRPDRVVAAGTRHAVPDLEQVEYFERLPASAVLDHSLLCLTHGGSGSVYQALDRGVPVACWPSHRNHEILAERIEELGLGVHLTPRNWPDKVESLITGFDQMRARTEELARTRMDGPGNAAREIADVILQCSPK